MASLADQTPSLEDDVSTLLSQLRENPPAWLTQGRVNSGGAPAQDAATAAMVQAMAAARAEAEAEAGAGCGGCGGAVVAAVPFNHFSKATEDHWKQVEAADAAKATIGTTTAAVNDGASSTASEDWYGKAEDWWADPEKAPASVDGVLGGFGELSPVDVKESAQFLTDLKTLRPAFGMSSDLVMETRALDGGAGIGRVAKLLLAQFFDKIDLVEGNRRLLNTAPEFMAVLDGGTKRRNPHMGNLFCTTLQDFVPERGAYDCIWVQWVVIYLTDVDFVRFLRRCAEGLRPGGLIVVKENVLGDTSTHRGRDFLLDDEDSSLTRSKPYMRHIFKEAGLRIFLEEQQQDWHPSMLPVAMYALEPEV